MFIVATLFCLASLSGRHRPGMGVEMVQPFIFFGHPSFEETKPGVSHSDRCARIEEPLASWRLSTNDQGESFRLPTRTSLVFLFLFFLNLVVSDATLSLVKRNAVTSIVLMSRLIN